MPIFLIASEKGGVGKSTIATNLAVVFAKNFGLDVGLVDTDPQASATTWNRIRQDTDIEPSITTMNMTGRIGRDLVSLNKKFDVLIVDAGGRDSIEVREAAAIASLWVIPTIANHLDLWALNTSLSICKNTERDTGHRPKAFVLINRIDVLPSIQDANELADSLAAHEEMRTYMPTCPIRLCSRKDYERAPGAGMGVIEYAQGSKAAKEVIELASYMIEAIK